MITKIFANPAPTPTCLRAEWDDHNAILLTWPHPDTDWAPILSEAEGCYYNIAKAIAPYERLVILTHNVDYVKEKLSGIDPTRFALLPCPTNDTWTRDYGPLTCQSPVGPIVKTFGFNGWGLKFAACLDNQASSAIWRYNFIDPATVADHKEFILEGGSIESDGEGTLLTTESCLLSLNRNNIFTREAMEHALARYFDIKRVIWLSAGQISGDDTDGHIDTLARLCDPRTIAYVGPPADMKDPDYAPLALMEDQLRGEARDYKLIKLPYAGPVYDPADPTHRLPATYANFLISPHAVFVPIYGLPTDRQALELIADCFPERDIVGINCLTLIRQHGSLHCATMQLYLPS